MKRWHAGAVGMIAGIALVLPNASAQTAHPDHFNYATSTVGKWDLTASTEIYWGDTGNPPTVRRVICRGDNQDIAFDVDASGSLYLRMRFLGTPDSDGDRDEMTLLGDHLWLYVDDGRWEFAHIPARFGAFSNVEYPPPESDIVTGGWHGHEAVRKAETDPWRNVNILNERLLAARKVAWGYKSRNWKQVDASIPANRLPKNWEKTRYPIDTVDLAAAVTWCARQVSSDAAYVLPANLKEAVKP